ncbi:MAG: single-stranded DNA-binding protein [Eubacterium sp.]|nr:single-stranded DNA-binding protein [Eubacterium sp.]
MYNRVIMMGRIANDLELKTTTNGASVLSFRIAVDRRYQTKGEERKTDFFNVVAWRNEAEFISRYFSKGNMIHIEGELQTRSYNDKNGNTVYVTEIITDRACFTGEKANGGQQSPYQNYSAPAHPAENTNNTAPAVSQGAPADFTESDDDDDYPF